MTVTVVIPTYNNADQIARTLDSVCAQTLPPHQIIVIDDGSTDNTARIIKNYDPKVTYLHLQNAGASAARNAGINAADGEWIAFLDGDDEWLPEYLEKQVKLLKANTQLQWIGANYYRCYCQKNQRIIAENSKKAKQTLKGKDYFDSYFQAYMNQTRGWTGTMIIKRSVFDQVGLFNPDQLRFNDEDMWWRIAAKKLPFGYNTEPLAIYHMNIKDSITKKYAVHELFAEFLDRQLHNANKEGCLEMFAPCAEHMLRYWIHEFWYDENVVHIRYMVDRFANILPDSYKKLVRLLTIYPKATSTAMPILSMINKIFKLKL